MPPITFAKVAPILLLIGSNIFMTFAWYGHLKHNRSTPVLIVIAVSWAIALVEYCLAVPANRIGRAVYSTAQLKTMQEVITLCVFVVFAWVYLGEGIKWNHAVSFLFLVGAVLFHAFNGIRLILIDFWAKGPRYQRQLMIGVGVIWVVLFVPFVIRHLTHVFGG